MKQVLGRAILVGAATSCVPAALASQDAPEETTAGTASLGGVVLDARTGRPVSGARVEVEGHDDVALTRSNGQFTLTDVSAGRRSFRVHVGDRRTRAQTVDLPASRHTEIRIALRLPRGDEPEPSDVVTLPPLEVQVSRSDHPGKMRRFFERARSGRGSYVTREDIERRSPDETADLLRDIPGIRVTRVRGGRQIVTSNRGCRLPIFLDGLPVPGMTVDEIGPHDVEGMEVYASAIEAPPRFRSRSTCGALVIWTRDPGRSPD